MHSACSERCPPPSATPAPTGKCVTYTLVVYIGECVYVCIYIVHAPRGACPPPAAPAPAGKCVTCTLIVNIGECVYVCIYIL